MLYIFVKHYIFKENAICLKESIRRQGYECQLTDKFDYNTSDFYIIFGSHDLIEKMPNNYIIYQLEQSSVGYYNEKDEFIDNNHKTFNKKYIEILQNAYQIWDYSYENITFFNKINQELDKKINCKYVPLCYSDYLTQTSIKKNEDKNIDILFFGSLNNRRKKILNKLKQKKLNIEIYSNLMGEEKISKILNSKIILNLHFYEKSLLETHRINHLLANNSFVISELSRDNIENNNYQNSVIFCKYNDIITTCLNWLNKEKEERDKIAKQGNDWVKQLDIIKYISEDLEKISSKKVSSKKRKNKKINYYYPSEIENAEVQKINGGAVLKLDGIIDDMLPNVTLITPTGNRRKLFSIAIRNFQNIIYPENKIEWLIVDDGTELMEDIIPNDNRIKYVKLDVTERLPIGKKRNLCIEMAKYNHIAFMDDDDYYAPENLIARIKTLLKYNKKCVGCSAVGNYNLYNNQSLLATDGPMFLCEATMAFEKNFWKERNFNNNDLLGEYKYFQHHRQKEMISIPFQFVMIAFNHKGNITGHTRNYNNELYEKNKEKYTDLYQIFDDETKVFINDLKKYLGIKNTNEFNFSELNL